MPRVRVRVWRLPDVRSYREMLFSWMCRCRSLGLKFVVHAQARVDSDTAANLVGI